MKKSLLILAMGFSMAFGQNQYNPLEQFKKRIGYIPADQKAANSRVQETAIQPMWMVGSWSGIKELSQFSQGWEIRSSFHGGHPERVEATLRLMNPENDVSVELFNYPSSELAEKAFFKYAIAHNVSIPYGATKRKIGNLSARHERKPQVWLQKDNYYMRIDCTKAALDPEVVAEWLVAYADSKLVSDLTPYLPVPQYVVVKPEYPRVGQELEIFAEMQDKVMISRYLFYPSCDPEVFMPLASNGKLSHRVKATKAGKSVVKYTLVDTQTSLFHKGEIVIDVAP